MSGFCRAPFWALNLNYMSGTVKYLAAAILALSVISCEKFSYLIGGEEKTGGTEAISIVPKRSTLEAAGGKLYLSVSAQGSWTLTATYPSGTASWGNLDPTSGSGSKGDVLFRYEANTGAARNVTFTLKSGGASTSVDVHQLGQGEGQTGRYGYDTAPMDWLELPACKAGDGRELLVHDMKGNKYVSSSKSGLRNWSCYWDYDAHLSLWVAYPLNKSIRGSGSRSDAWGAYDPIIPSSMQPNMAGTYGWGTRGHQLPSADRYVPEAANISTFFPTNLTPQDYDFNGGAWAGLEGKVRNYSDRSDTLYVVTGCCFDKSVNTTPGKSGFAVKIPTHYFKALLYKGSSTHASKTGGYIAAAFYLEHDSKLANENFMNYIMTVDELEELTGIDFFPNLALKVGSSVANQIESELTPFWNN